MTLALVDLPAPRGPLARRDPRWKLAAIVLAALVVAALRTLPAAAAALGGALVLLVLARPPFRWARDRLLVIAVALSPFLLLLPFTLLGDSTWDVGPVVVSERGVRTAVVVFLKGLTVVAL